MSTVGLQWHAAQAAACQVVERKWDPALWRGWAVCDGHEVGFLNAASGLSAIDSRSKTPMPVFSAFPSPTLPRATFCIECTVANERRSRRGSACADCSACAAVARSDCQATNVTQGERASVAGRFEDTDARPGWTIGRFRDAYGLWRIGLYAQKIQKIQKILKMTVERSMYGECCFGELAGAGRPVGQGRGGVGDPRPAWKDRKAQDACMLWMSWVCEDRGRRRRSNHKSAIFSGRERDETARRTNNITGW